MWLLSINFDSTQVVSLRNIICMKLVVIQHLYAYKYIIGNYIINGMVYCWHLPSQHHETFMLKLLKFLAYSIWIKLMMKQLGNIIALFRLQTLQLHWYGFKNPPFILKKSQPPNQWPYG